jgi:class 3 adenylate cyclase
VLTVGGPIAKLYPETTVMFADIKGFTKWSASREPTQVFHLLETLYGAFDQLAKLYGVFKVETIGDTYVAVVGLPTPRKNHAVIIAKFAKKCLEKMTELTQELEEVLGLVREFLFFSRTFVCSTIEENYSNICTNLSCYRVLQTYPFVWG